MSSMQDWALYYQSLGMSVVPVNRSTKQPHVRWRDYQLSKPTEEMLREWFSQWPDADVGIITGPISGCLVVDFDGPDGMASMIKYEWPKTRSVQTRNGQQLHYLWDDRLLACKTTLVKPFPLELPGVDTRGNKGFTKMEPSLYSDGSGRYRWINGLDTPLAHAPEWLIKMLLDRKEAEVTDRKESGDSWLQEKLNGLKSGNRNSTFTSIAGSFRSRGYSSPDIYSTLEPHAIAVDFPLDELQTICNSVGSYAPNEAPQSSEVFTFKTDVDAYLGELQERSKHLEPEFCTGFPSLDRITKGFPRKNLYVIGAPTNGGKTQFVLSNILALLKKKKRVLYFSTEMPQNEIRDRFNALGARIPIEEITSGFLKTENKQKLVDFLTTFDSSNFIISPEDTPTLETVKVAIEKASPDIVVLDHLHHVKMVSENRRVEIDDFITGLKKLVLQHNIPCVVTAQLRRKEGFDGKPPVYTMHDFKESGGIENEAGVCVLLCPPTEWTTDKIQHVTAYVPKNRHGKREVRFSLEFNTEIAEFREPGYL